jgi:hypothetical protein
LGGGNWNTLVSIISFVTNEFVDGDITGGETGELTIVDDNPAG